MTKFLQLTPDAAARLWQGTKFRKMKTREEIERDMKFAQGAQNYNGHLQLFGPVSMYQDASQLASHRY